MDFSYQSLYICGRGAALPDTAQQLGFRILLLARGVHFHCGGSNSCTHVLSETDSHQNAILKDLMA